MSKILHLKMGGTIDSNPYPPEYQPDAEPNGNNESYKALKALIEAHAPNMHLHFKEICDLDSKNVGELEKRALGDAIAQAENQGDFKRIIVTTGSDRMAELGRDLENRNIGQTLPVVLTGAIWPLLNTDRTDGHQNLRQALTHPFGNGVHMTVGKFFGRAATAKKDFEKREFVEMSAEEVAAHSLKLG